MNDHAAANPSSIFNEEMADAYDRRNSGLRPISDCLHFLVGLVVQKLPRNARVLCVGVGTGAEILSLAAAHPDWTFVGIDPSAEMLDFCRERLEDAGIAGRYELVHGYIEDVAEEDFDAVVTLLVAHFIQLKDRTAFYCAIHQRLKSGGRFVSAEISADVHAQEFPGSLEDWKQVQAPMGATQESLASLEDTLRNVLGVIPPDVTQALWQDAGFSAPVPFFQAFMIRGWHADKRPSTPPLPDPVRRGSSSAPRS